MRNDQLLLHEIVREIEPISVSIHDEVRGRFGALAIPPNALGRLVDPVARLAASQWTSSPVANPAVCAVFVADHGIAHDDTVTPWPREVTRSVAELAAQGRAACSAIARSVGAELTIIDVGIATGPTPDGVNGQRVRDGSGDLRNGGAISNDDVHAACEVGARIAESLIDDGARILTVGEIGIGNTTAAAALIAVLADADPLLVTGRGSGIDDAALARKRDVVSDLVARCRNRPIIEILSHVGALEVCALAGFMIAASRRRTPVVLDGVTTLAAALVAREISVHTADHLIAGHRSPEPAVDAALTSLGLEPMVDFGLRVGEGTGGLLALPLLAAGCEILSSVARLDEVT